MTKQQAVGLLVVVVFLLIGWEVYSSSRPRPETVEQLEARIVLAKKRAEALDAEAKVAELEAKKPSKPAPVPTVAEKKGERPTAPPGYTGITLPTISFAPSPPPIQPTLAQQIKLQTREQGENYLTVLRLQKINLQTALKNWGGSQKTDEEKFKAVFGPGEDSLYTDQLQWLWIHQQAIWERLSQDRAQLAKYQKRGAEEWKIRGIKKLIEYNEQKHKEAKDKMDKLPFIVYESIDSLEQRIRWVEREIRAVEDFMKKIASL